jgi:hypothetical protein
MLSACPHIFYCRIQSGRGSLTPVTFRTPAPVRVDKVFSSMQYINAN